MASLTDLFNPTFLMFLGILVLVVALLVVYFETKFRDQNHKISSMLSLVSSLAEEVNGTKMIIHQLTMLPQTQNFYQNKEPTLEETIQIKQNNYLIAVSDDESEDDDDDESDSEAASKESFSDDDSDEESVNSDDEDSVSVIEIGEHNPDIKIFKLNISKNDEDSESDKIDELSVASLDDLDDLDELSVASLDELDDNSSTSSESIKENDKANDFMDLKSINITLEETKSEQSVDYKKMALPKLRSVISEKGLSKDSSKLKKNELLKLLGVE